MQDEQQALAERLAAMRERQPPHVQRKLSRRDRARALVDAGECLTMREAYGMLADMGEYEA